MLFHRGALRPIQCVHSAACQCRKCAYTRAICPRVLARNPAGMAQYCTSAPQSAGSLGHREQRPRAPWLRVAVAHLHMSLSRRPMAATGIRSPLGMGVGCTPPLLPGLGTGDPAPRAVAQWFAHVDERRHHKARCSHPSLPRPRQHMGLGTALHCTSRSASQHRMACHPQRQRVPQPAHASVCRRRTMHCTTSSRPTVRGRNRGGTAVPDTSPVALRDRACRQKLRPTRCSAHACVRHHRNCACTATTPPTYTGSAVGTDLCCSCACRQSAGTARLRVPAV